MTLRARLLNAWLRAVEKPRMRRARGAEPLRRNLELQSRIFFHPPRGTRMAWEPLGSGKALRVTPGAGEAETLILYFHGGGFVFGSPKTHAALVGQVAVRANASGVLPHYRLAPEHPYPAAFEDAVAAWEGCLDLGYDPAQIVLGGDSAGGCLALALLGYLIAEGQALPGRVFAFSPLTDMHYAGNSFRANAEKEVLLASERADEMGQMYLNGHPKDDPRVSPVFADFTGAPPVWLCVGDTEILLDDTRRLRDRMIEQGVDVTCQVESDLPHVWPIFHSILPEARTTLDALGAWLRTDRVTSRES